MRDARAGQYVLVARASNEKLSGNGARVGVRNLTRRADVMVRKVVGVERWNLNYKQSNL